MTDYLLLLRRRWALLLLCCLAGLGVGAATTVGKPPTYQAEATVFLTLNRSASVSELAQGSTYTQGLIQSYVLLVSTPEVLTPVIERLGLPTTPRALARQVTATSPVDTVLIDIAATSTSPETAAQIANAVGDQLATSVADLAPAGTTQGDQISVRTVSPATVPVAAIGPRKKLAAAVGLAAGLAGGVAFMVLRELLDTRVRDEEGVAQVTEAPVLGVIRQGGADLAARGAHAHSSGPEAESYRRLRSNVQFLDLEGATQSVVVTSSTQGEGKTTTAINLAVAMADTDVRVLLVDADLRQPTVAQVLGLEPGVGLATLLGGRASLDEVLQPWGTQRMDVIAAGEIPPNPNELLGSRRMADLLAATRERYDVVVIDSPPLLPVSDAAVLAAQVDGALLVVSGRTPRKHVAHSIQSLHLARARLMGVVLNRVRSAVSVPHYELSPARSSRRDGRPRRWALPRPLRKESSEA
nr:polysaccharide biosynthesis tyrosine autokinase [Kineococcus siccus]